MEKPVYFLQKTIPTDAYVATFRCKAGIVDVDPIDRLSRIEPCEADIRIRGMHSLAEAETIAREFTRVAAAYRIAVSETSFTRHLWNKQPRTDFDVSVQSLADIAADIERILPLNEAADIWKCVPGRQHLEPRQWPSLD